MADYTTRYLFEVDIVERDIDRKAKQIARQLQLALERNITATSGLVKDELELSMAIELANKAITSQTRRLPANIRRL